MFDKVSVLKYVIGNMVCYTSCFAANCATCSLAVIAIIPTLGFATAGIKAGSWAAKCMSLHGGNVNARSLLAMLQADGAKGEIKWPAIPYANVVCNHLCYNK